MSATYGAGRRPKGLVVCCVCTQQVHPEGVDSIDVEVGDVAVPGGHGNVPSAKLWVHAVGCNGVMRDILKYMRPRPPEPFGEVILKRVKRAIAAAKRKG